MFFSYYLQMRNLRLQSRRRDQLWDQGLHMLSGCRMDQSKCFRDAWVLCQRLPITPHLISGNGMSFPGEAEVACLVDVQEAFIPTLGAAVGEMHILGSSGLSSQYPGIMVGPAAQPRNVSSTPGLERHLERGPCLWLFTWEGKEGGREGGRGASSWSLLFLKQAARRKQLGCC